MPKDYSDRKLYGEEEILDVLLGLDIVYQSKTFIGKWLYWPWHVCLETIAVMLTGNELHKRAAVDEVEEMLREEGFEDEDD